MSEAAAVQGPSADEGDEVLSTTFSVAASAGRFTRPGVTWFVQHMFVGDTPESPDELFESLATYVASADEILKGSVLLEGLDIEDESHTDEALERLKDRRDLPEWWAFMIGVRCAALRDAVDNGDAQRAAWISGQLSAFRAVLAFMTALEPLTWRGYTTPGLDSLRALVTIWSSEQENSTEEYWQQLLLANQQSLAQIIPQPIMVHQDKAYVGGKALDNRGGKYVDFLVQNTVAGAVALVEIKTPVARLLQNVEYRSNVFVPSFELIGAVAQVQRYREMLMRDYLRFRADDPNWETVDPACFVLVGNAAKELDTLSKRESFELYRRGLRNVHIVTYDEMFAKLAQLLSALSLGR